MIYGYALKTVDEEYGLLELREITFIASPAVLREVAQFLTTMADLIDEPGAMRTSHRHIDEFIADWRQRFPDKDIVVARP